MGFRATLQDPGITQVDVDGETIPVAWVESRFQVGFRAQYRGETINATTLARVRNQVRRLRDEAERKAARKAATSTPLPAMAVRGGTVQQVSVRGLHGVSGEPLLTLTYPPNAKTTGDSHSLLRPLSDTERAELQAALDAREAARVAQVRSPTWSALEDRYNVTVSASYDPAAEEWVAEYDGTSYRGDGAASLDTKILEAVLRRDYPWDVKEGEAVEADPELARRRHYFTTRDEAQAYLDTTDAYNRAAARVDELLARYRFNLTIFKDEG